MIAIGKIIKPHGILGMLKIKSDTDFKQERFKVGSTLMLTGVKPQKVTVKSYAYQPNMELISFEEITDRTAAEKIVGSIIEVDESVQTPLPQDEFYFNDLNGLSVLRDGEKIGTVIDVLDYPQGAMLRVKLEEKTVLIPFLKVFVKTVDLEAKTLTLIEWDGLI
jgi:16S rRNA processing protein RimM